MNECEHEEILPLIEGELYSCSICNKHFRVKRTMRRKKSRLAYGWTVIPPVDERGENYTKEVNEDGK